MFTFQQPQFHFWSTPGSNATPCNTSRRELSLTVLPLPVCFDGYRYYVNTLLRWCSQTRRFPVIPRCLILQLTDFEQNCNILFLEVEWIQWLSRTKYSPQGSTHIGRNPVNFRRSGNHVTKASAAFSSALGSILRFPPPPPGVLKILHMSNKHLAVFETVRACILFLLFSTLGFSIMAVSNQFKCS